jgi:asparagine synthase (glutamine-hydrolysing)
MCGIAGAVHLKGPGPSPELLGRMTTTLHHRGPDDEATWSGGPVGLGLARLAIIDLSLRARQPMTNEDGSLWLVFNGEIYNFQELRAELRRHGHVFRSQADSEVILHLYEDRGVECLHDLRGMFALALWDASKETLVLARDRLGKKPLFYYHDDAAFVFASEPKAILQHPRVRAEAEPEAIHHYLTYGSVPHPWSAFRGIRKLPPAHYLVLTGSRARIDRYWSLRYAPKRTEGEAVLAEELSALLEEAVRLRLVSDVPLGALLSGGIDSSTIVALMRRLTSGPVRTFSIGFDRPEYDELGYAREVARRFETEQHDMVVKPDAVNVLPRLVWHYNEPFADSSAIPSMALCEMARQFVTVALNGDGGDESFAGYDRYRAVMLAGWSDRVPRPVRRGLGRALSVLPSAGPKSLSYRARRFVAELDFEERRRYAGWISVFNEATQAELYTPEFASETRGMRSLELLDQAYRSSDAGSFLERTLHADVQRYLPDDLLVKMDIASMASALEVRSPFLDHKVVEFAARLPMALKLRRLTQKYILKRAMGGVLPATVLRRPKMGFGVPIDHWFRHELRPMAYDLLLDARARGRGYFRAEVVRRYLDEHVAGRTAHHARLWSLLVLELWHRMFIDQPCPAKPPGAAG